MKSKLSSFWQWVKRHWKIIAPITAAVLLAIILGCSIPACIAAKPNGTYYKVKSNGELDREDYFTLKSGTWTDADGASGEYKKDGDRILFYIEFFGEKEVLAEGTLSNYVLSMEDENYISKKHKHRYGAWEKISEPTCVMDGKGERECACGVKETKIIKATHSTGDWIFDYTSHWKECTNCGKKVEEAAHFGDDKCKICNFPLVDTVGLSFTLNSKGNAYTVSGIGSVTDKIIRIPATYEGLPVVGIGDYAFKDELITQIIFPDSINSISDSAFSGCNNLQYNEYENAYYLGNANNPYLVLVKAKSNDVTTFTVNENTKLICDSAFSDCSSLTSITIPESVTSIGDLAFRGCGGLESITVASGNTKYIGIGNCLIEKDSKTLILGCKNSVIPTDGSVTSIGNCAFDNCRSLTSVTIGNGVTSIGNYAFYNCSSLTSVTIGNSVTSIGKYAFMFCSLLTSISIPDSVTSIGDWAFVDCNILHYNESSNACYLGNTTNPYVILVKAKSTDITSCTINENTKFIYESAFSGCRSLTSITIPNSVTSIGNGAFSDCSSLQYNENDNAYYLGNATNPYLVLVEAKSNNITSCTVNENTKLICFGAFEHCYSLTSITIPDSVTSIGDGAFLECISLTSITIPDSVTSIGSEAFYYCSSLTSITIPDSVTSIGGSAFRGCRSLTGITIPNSVTSIGGDAFYYCSGLTSITFNGTKAQWKAISKGSSWNSNTGNYTVHCTDGDITKNAS